MSTMLRILLISSAALLPASCNATDLVSTSACDDAAALVARQYEDHRLESDELLAQKTGRRRLYYQAVLDPQLNEEQLEALKADPKTSKSVMASLSLAGNVGRLSRLVSSGLSVNSVSDDGVPILVIAAQCERVDVVNELLDLGADIYAHDRQNIDSMAAAILEDSDAVVRVLVDRGYKIDNGTKSGQVASKLAQSLHNGKYGDLKRKTEPE